MRIVRLKRADTDQEAVMPLAAVESLALVLDRVPNGIAVMVMTIEEMAEADFHDQFGATEGAWS